MAPRRYFYQIRSEDGKEICDYKHRETAEHDLPYIRTLYPGCEIYKWKGSEWVKLPRTS